MFRPIKENYGYALCKGLKHAFVSDEAEVCLCGEMKLHQNGGEREKNTDMMATAKSLGYFPAPKNKEKKCKHGIPVHWCGECVSPVPKNEGEKGCVACDNNGKIPRSEIKIGKLIPVCEKHLTAQPPAGDWEEIIAGQLKLIEENRLGVERGESIDLQEPLKNGLNETISHLLKEAEDRGYVSRGIVEAEIKAQLIKENESKYILVDKDINSSETTATSKEIIDKISI